MAEDTNAQVQPTDAASPAPEGDGKDGVQKRIDELTRQRYEEAARREAAEQQTAALTAQYATLLQTVNQMAARPAAPEEPAPEIDPDEVKKFGYLAKSTFGKEFERLTKMVEQQNATIAQLTGGVQETQVSSRYAPEVIAEAKKLVNSGFAKDLKTACTFVLGQLAEKGQDEVRAARAKGRMNGVGGTNTLGFANPGPGAESSERVSVQGLPENFAKLTPQEQMKALKARNPKLGDQPL